MHSYAESSQSWRGVCADYESFWRRRSSLFIQLRQDRVCISAALRAVIAVTVYAFIGALGCSGERFFRCRIFVLELAHTEASINLLILGGIQLAMFAFARTTSQSHFVRPLVAPCLPNNQDNPGSLVMPQSRARVSVAIVSGWLFWRLRSAARLRASVLWPVHLWSHQVGRALRLRDSWVRQACVLNYTIHNS